MSAFLTSMFSLFVASALKQPASCVTNYDKSVDDPSQFVLIVFLSRELNSQVILARRMTP